MEEFKVQSGASIATRYRYAYLKGLDALYALKSPQHAIEHFEEAIKIAQGASTVDKECKYVAKCLSQIARAESVLSSPLRARFLSQKALKIAPPCQSLDVILTLVELNQDESNIVIKFLDMLSKDPKTEPYQVILLKYFSMTEEQLVLASSKLNQFLLREASLKGGADSLKRDGVPTLKQTLSRLTQFTTTQLFYSACLSQLMSRQ
jgi:tetratricopeptide (TPR) repeat protein